MDNELIKELQDLLLTDEERELLRSAKKEDVIIVSRGQAAYCVGVRKPDTGWKYRVVRKVK